MFRNGLSVSRRRLRQPALNVAATTHMAPTPAQTHPELPFVCRTCQARGMATSTKPKKKVNKAEKGETLLEQIKKLEAHVQMMERAYADKIRQRIVESTIPDGDITDEMKDEAYAALMAPPSETDMFLPAPTQLVDSISKSVQLRLSEVGAEKLLEAQTPDWNSIVRALDADDGFRDFSAGDVNSMVRCMEYDVRAKMAPLILDKMEEGAVVPDTYTYDLFMIALNKVAQPDQVKVLFKDMQERGLEPTVYSYSHYINACAKTQDVVAATKAFKDMQAANIEPNLIVYTTLVQTFVKSRDYPTAWQVFNLLKYKSQATAPDEAVYALMMHVCAETGEAEKAEELWRELTARVEVPKPTSFESIIHACAMRKDYFSQAWQYAADMNAAGYPLERRTLNVLLSACAKAGELTRARILVRHMMASAPEANMQPDKFTYQNFLQCYVTYKPPESNPRAQKAPALSIQPPGSAPGGSNPESNPANEALFMLPENRLMKSPHAPNEAIEIPFLPKAVLQNYREVLDEAALVVNWIRDNYASIADSQFMNTYLSVCSSQVSHGALSDLRWSYENDFTNPPIPGQPDPETPDPLLADLPRVPRNLFTFDIALNAAVQSRNLAFAERVWRDRVAYTQSPEYAAFKPSAREKLDFRANRNMIYILALSNHLQEACEAIRRLADEQGYVWKWEDLRTVYVKAVQLEDPETIAVVRRYTAKEDGDEGARWLVEEDVRERMQAATGRRGVSKSDYVWSGKGKKKGKRAGRK